MSSHDKPTTPPKDPKQLQALVESNQATKPNKGSSASGQLLTSVTKEGVKPGIQVDMDQRKYCNLEDMVRFLLALCCCNDSSTTPKSPDESTETRFIECLRSVAKIASSDELKEKLESYKSSTSAYERDMYLPFVEAMNYALECLSDIEVDGLPKFKSHIAFVPCNKGVQSDRDIGGSSFKPDIAIMSIQDACEVYQLDESCVPELSKFTGQISGKSLSGLTWKAMLSAIEMKRKGVNRAGPSASKRQGSVIQDTDQQLDEEFVDSQPATSTSSMTRISSKRSASVAGMDANAGTSSSKRPRGTKKPAKKVLANQNGIYSAEKFSDSFSISHVLNLLIENDCLRVSWIDREGPILSSGCSFFEELSLTLVLLLVLQRFGRRQWGYIPELDTEDHRVLLHPVNADGALGGDKIAINFDPDDKVHSAWTLLGRATTVVGANKDRGGDSRITGEDHAMELAHGGIEGGTVGDSQRPDAEGARQTQQGSESENGSPHEDPCAGLCTVKIKPSIGVSTEDLNEEWRDFYRARDEYRETCAKTLESRDLVLKVSWPETSRTAEWKTIKHARTLGENDKFIKDHIPEVRGARDFDYYSTNNIRRFLGIQQGAGSGTRTLRLIAMDRLWPIHDLDGEQFWKAFWECVLCHYRLWASGIYHGDISLKNLMYGISKDGDPLGIVNDFDLATSVGHSTTNNDRTGTIPFMAIDLLDGGLDLRIPRLYRHDLESFCWVLAYTTVAEMEYEPRTINISQPLSLPWFQDNTQAERTLHIKSKQFLHLEYDQAAIVSARYFHYVDTVQKIIQYWTGFHESRMKRRLKGRSRGPKLEPGREEQAPREPEVDNPADSLSLFVDEVDKSLGEVGVGFADVKVRLLEAIGIPATASAT